MKFIIKIGQYLCLIFITVPATAFAVDTLQSGGQTVQYVAPAVPGGQQTRSLPFKMETNSTQVIGPSAEQAARNDAARNANGVSTAPYLNNGGSTTASKNLVPCDGTDCTIQMILTMGVKIYNYLTGFGAILAVGAIVVGGFSYITAQGDSSKMSAAKEIIVNAIIGIVVLAASALVVNTVINWISKGEGLKGNSTTIKKVEDVKAQ